MRLPTSPSGGPPDGPPDTPAAPAGAATDAVALLRQLGADPRPRLTWYGPDDQRVELTGRVLHTWVAKTAHLLLEEADVVPGSRVLVRLGADWRAPVFWLAAWYLGAQVLHQDQGAPADVDVVGLSEVRGDHEAARSTTAVLVVVPPGAVAAPAEGLPPGAVDYGGEVSGFPDVPPAPGPRTPLGPPAAEARRVLVGPEGSPDRVVATWAAGGSVVLHTGLPAAALERVAAQERTDP
ncbi:TIGR03089 family protein [Aquipuribacter hungaricus]|uniref:TIGR03089 family protein n=2 Tax=Aquipuribacter hungaricus TaxID=545624 RepID=A0ABV7WDB1_9MICO